MNDKALDIFGPTIRTCWNVQNSNLKKGHIDYFVSLFGETFNKIGVAALTDTHLKHMREKQWFICNKNPRYECLLMISRREWKNQLEYSKDKTMRKE